MEDIQFAKNSLGVIGAGGLGRELVSWMVQDDLFLNEFKLTGFLDDNILAIDGILTDLELLDKLTLSTLNKLDSVILAIADITYKKKIFDWISESSLSKFISYKYKNAIVGSFTKIGNGVVLCPFVVVSCNVVIGNAVFINIGSQIGHDVQIGNYVSIMANVDIGGGAIIEDEVFIGSGAVILPGVRIAKGTRVGAGSVVIKNIKKQGTYFGNPAKKIF